METASAAGSEAEKLVTSLLSTVETYKTGLEKSKADYKQNTDLDNFLVIHNDGYGIIGMLRHVAINVYAECMKSAGVETWAEIEQACNKYNQNPEVKDALSKLWKQEDSYNKFMIEIEEDLSELEANVDKVPPTKPGQLLPKNQLVEIPSGQPVTLESCCKGSKQTLFILLRLLG